jgi:hypothetical protein
MKFCRKKQVEQHKAYAKMRRLVQRFYHLID